MGQDLTAAILRSMTAALICLVIACSTSPALACSRDQPPSRQQILLFPPGVRGPVDIAKAIAVVRPVAVRVVAPALEHYEGRFANLRYDLKVERVLKGDLPSTLTFGIEQLPAVLRVDDYGAPRIVRHEYSPWDQISPSRLAYWEGLGIGAFGALGTGGDCIPFASLRLDQEYLAFLDSEGRFFAGSMSDAWTEESVKLLLSDPARMAGPSFPAKDLLAKLDELSIYEVLNCARKRLRYVQEISGQIDAWQRTLTWAELMNEYRRPAFPSPCSRGQRLLVVQRALALPINTNDEVDTTGMQVFAQLSGERKVALSDVREARARRHQR